jgi:hypothetical protein
VGSEGHDGGLMRVDMDYKIVTTNAVAKEAII